MDSRHAHEIFSFLNNEGLGFALTEHSDIPVTDEIAEAGLEIVTDHGGGLIECIDRNTSQTYLIGGDALSRNAWAVRVGTVPPKCVVCGSIVDLSDMHPDSDEIPTDGSEFSAFHAGCANGEDCWSDSDIDDADLDDNRAWIKLN